MVSLKSSSGNRAAELFGLCARGVLKRRIAALRERGVEALSGGFSL
jgi:hypothetical protein